VTTSPGITLPIRKHVDNGDVYIQLTEKLDYEKPPAEHSRMTIVITQEQDIKLVTLVITNINDNEVQYFLQLLYNFYLCNTNIQERTQYPGF